MTGPRRWPVHPAPVDGEALSSWLNRIAGCYGTDIERLGDDIGYKLRPGKPDDIDLAPPPGMIDILTERTGATRDRLRRMTIAGWVPWLLDDMVPGPNGFATYTRQLSVLRPVGKQKARQVPSWRPWLSDYLPSRACPQCVAASPSPQPHQLLWAIPIVSSCPAHGCWLETTIATRGYFGIWDYDRPTARPAPEQILTMDQRTHDAFAVGRVDLPRRQVHAGIWFRLLRAIIDELSCPVSENRPSGARTIRRIWEEAGYRVRDGQALWRPYEQQPQMVQRHTMEAAATAVQLLQNGTITGQGKDAALFTPAPPVVIDDGTDPRDVVVKVDLWRQAMETLEVAVEDARHNPDAARQLFYFMTYNRTDADSLHDACNLFDELHIPISMPSH